MEGEMLAKLTQAVQRRRSGRLIERNGRGAAKKEPTFSMNSSSSPTKKLKEIVAEVRGFETQEGCDRRFQNQGRHRQGYPEPDKEQKSAGQTKPSRAAEDRHEPMMAVESDSRSSWPIELVMFGQPQGCHAIME